MSFDKDTRNLLAKTVTACRRRLTGDVTDQLRGVFGLHPDGTVLALKEMTHLSPDQTAAAGRLRDLLDHYTAGAAGGETDRRKSAYERMTLEISFTILNRLAALRLCEERELVVECVRKGTASDGYRLFERVSGGALGGRYDTYRVFLECLFDELALDLGVLFDRMTPQSAVFPTERCMEDVLAELNKLELSHLWVEDETIGWVYQYFNPPEERKAMRDASAAPRNSRELAVRNQFFTPRYVVEFLTDNTLGRVWYEMRKGETALKEECRYLVRRPNEVFLLHGREAPAAEENEADLSQEELLKKTVYIEHRPKKDPRDLRVLDPACGSGHFLLYTFDLLERIYAEAWGDPASPKSEVIGRTIREDFENLEDLRRAVPKLIIEHNLHGIDIDPRAVQIAALALWLRAQKTWKNLNIKAAERPQVAKSNIVTAEPMPGEEDMKEEFTASLKPLVLGQLVDMVFDKMKLAGEAGSLLKIEEEIKDAVAEAKKQWFEVPKPEQTVLFPELVSAKPQQMELRFDLTGVTDERFWGQAEERILAALKDYAERTENGRAVRRWLFAEDAARGFAFIDLCRKRYDIILMNPPFGEFTGQTKAFAQTRYPNTKNDIYGAFVERTIAITTTNGHIGGITPRTWLTLTRFEGLREAILDRVSLDYLIDLGYNVLESMAEVSVFVLSRFKTSTDTAFLRAFSAADKMSKVGKLVDELALLQIKEVLLADINRFRNIPQKIFAFGLPKSVLDSISQGQTIEGSGHFAVKQGIATGDNDRFLRLQTEIPASSQPREWIPYAKGGNFGMFHTSLELAVKWHRNGLEIKTRAAAEYGSASRTIKNEGTYFTPGLTFSLVSQAGFSVRVLPAGCIYDMGGPCIFASSKIRRGQLKHFLLLSIVPSPNIVLHL